MFSFDNRKAAWLQQRPGPWSGLRHPIYMKPTGKIKIRPLKGKILQFWSKITSFRKTKYIAIPSFMTCLPLQLSLAPSHSPHRVYSIHTELQAYLVLLQLVLLSSTPQRFHFLQIEGKTLHQQRAVTCFIAILALLWCSEPNPQYFRGLPGCTSGSLKPPCSLASIPLHIQLCSPPAPASFSILMAGLSDR